MTQKTFDLLDFCSTRVKWYSFGIFQNRFIKNLIDDVPEEQNVMLSGMWLYYIASTNKIAIDLGYVADKTIQLDCHAFVYLYRLG